MVILLVGDEHGSQEEVHIQGTLKCREAEVELIAWFTVGGTIDVQVTTQMS